MTGLVRCTVDIGKKLDAVHILRLIEKTVSTDEARSAVKTYLTRTGVLIDATDPGGLPWFQWLDPEKTRFAARCADPRPGLVPTDNGHPCDYFVFAEVMTRTEDTWHALGYDFETAAEVRRLGHSGLR